MEENVIQFKSRIMINVNACVEKHHFYGKDYILNPTK